MSPVAARPHEAVAAPEAPEKVDPEQLAHLDRVIEGFADPDSALIPVLQKAQDLFGYLPRQVIEHVALKLGKPFSEVTGVVTFYSYFSTVPRGKNLVRVCLGTACYVRGGKDVLKALQDTLHIEVGQTTPDRQFSLEIGRCFGACGLAPAVMVNDEVHQQVKPARVRELLTSVDHEETKE